MNNFDVGDDLTITRVAPRHCGGTWVTGQLNGHRFEALVFPDHAQCQEWEYEQSRISKLWIQRIADQKAVFSWDRGLDIQAENDPVLRIVEFLAEGIADVAYADLADTEIEDRCEDEALIVLRPENR